MPAGEGAAVLVYRWRQGDVGMVAARFLAAVPGTRWDLPGRECGLLQLWLDGAYHQDVILVQGEVEAEYERLLGELGAGEHTLELRSRPDAPARPEAVVRELRAEQLRPRDALEAEALREAPVLYTRRERDPWESLWTDTPLLLFYRPRGAGIEFQCLFSNEDGGTDTRGLLAQWGRTTDIEWVLHVEGERATIQGRHHRTEVHSGQRALGRRTLQVVGLHGMVSAEPPSGVMRMLFVPRFRWDDRLPRESCMDAAPWTYRLTALEMLRQGRLTPGSDPADPTPGDLRDYAFVQVLREDADGARAGIEIRAHLADGRVFSSTHGSSAEACDRAIPFSTTVKLPPAARVRALEAVAVPDLERGEIRLRLHRAFRLGEDYLPLSPFAAGEPVTLRPQTPSAVLWREA